jgi:site-specific recombinase XerD
MAITDSIINYRRFLKRKNYSKYTIRNYMNTLKHFILWVSVPVEQITPGIILSFIDHLLDKRLKPKTINCYLDSIRGFYEHLIHEEGLQIVNPVKRGYALRLSNPLPRYIREEDIAKLFAVVKSHRDRAMFMLMLRCGLRVEEVARLTLAALDLRRMQVFVYAGKGAKDRVVYLSKDTHKSLVRYLKVRVSFRAKRVFLVEKGRFKGKPISVRGIQKCMEKYAQKSGLNVSCHQLRHTMATQLLNADADLATIQDLLGHTRIKTTQRYCRISNLKVQRDYYKAIERVTQRHAL